MRSPYGLLVVVAVGAALAGGPVRGQISDAYTDVREMPDTPAAARAREVLEVVSSGDASRVGRFIDEALHPEFRAAFPRARHESIFARVRAESGGYDFHSVRRYDPPNPDTTIVTIVRNRLTEAWEAFILEVEPEAPHRIVRLEFAGARPPSDLPPAEPLSDEKLVAALDAFVRRLAEADAFSGAVLVARDGEVLYETAVGLASRSFEAPNTIDTLFNLGSMNKMFTAVAIAKLVEAGRLSYDDPLSLFLGEEWLKRSLAARIRIANLLNHTSGLGSYFNEEFFESSRLLFREVADYRPLVVEEQLAFAPGQGNRYSNTGFLLLGAVIESVAGERYFDHIRRVIYEPAGMSRSDSYDMDVDVPNLAIGYSRVYGPGGTSHWENNLFKHVVRGGPAGGGFSTVRDLLRFDRALRSGTLVRPETAALLWSEKPASPDYGYGFGISGGPGHRIVGHGGGFPGISAQLDMYLDSEHTVVVLSNYDGAAQIVSERVREWLGGGE